MVIFHYGTEARPRTRKGAPVSTGSPVTSLEIVSQAGGAGLCQALMMQCLCYLEGVAPFGRGSVLLRGWQKIDVHVVDQSRVCEQEVPQQNPADEEEDLLALFDLGQHETAGSSWADARQVLVDRQDTS